MDLSEHALDGLDRIILASPTIDETMTARPIEFCRRQKIKLSMIPPIRGMFGTAVQLNHVADLPVVEYGTWDVSRSTYRPEHIFRIGLKPGTTGPMQVHGRGALTFEERLAVEREYMENLSLGRDLRILAMTVPTVVLGRGAY